MLGKDESNRFGKRDCNMVFGGRWKLRRLSNRGKQHADAELDEQG
jgi:hypothetical protein